MSSEPLIPRRTVVSRNRLARPMRMRREEAKLKNSGWFAFVWLFSSMVSAHEIPPSYQQANVWLNLAYRNLIEDLPATERNALRSAERRWVANRDLSCGSGNTNGCAARLTYARAKELDQRWIKRFMPRVGQCSLKKVAEVKARLPVEQSTGAYISYVNGPSQIDYDSSPDKLGFTVGDVVRLCVVAIPTNCPIGDHRGVIYRAVDMVTRRSWTAPDSQHFCGGA